MTVTIDLPPDVETKLAAAAAKQGITLPEYVRTIVEGSFEANEMTEEEPEEMVHPLIRLAEKARAGIPLEELAAIPPDLSKNLDHYLYGHPKVEE